MKDDNGRLYIKEDITDWQQETLRNETIIEKEEDIIDALTKEGRSTKEVARSTLVSRAMGKAPEEILRPNKILLTSGAELQINQIIDRQRSVVRTPKGSFTIQSYVGKLPMNDRGVPVEENDNENLVEENTEEDEPVDTGPSFTSINGQLASDRALGYLNRIVRGRTIRDRLIVIYKNGGNIREVAENLKRQIDELVEQII